MHIETSNSYTLTTQTASRTPEPVAKPADSSNGRSPANRTNSDSITLSAPAMQANNLSRTDTLEAVFDMNRVSAIKNSIHAGSYEIDPGQIAEKFYQFTMQMR